MGWMTALSGDERHELREAVGPTHECPPGQEVGLNGPGLASAADATYGETESEGHHTVVPENNGLAVGEGTARESCRDHDRSPPHAIPMASELTGSPQGSRSSRIASSHRRPLRPVYPCRGVLFFAHVMLLTFCRTPPRARVAVERLQSEPPESSIHSLTESPATDAIERVADLAREIDRDIHALERALDRRPGPDDLAAFADEVVAAAGLIRVEHVRRFLPESTRDLPLLNAVEATTESAMEFEADFGVLAEARAIRQARRESGGAA